MARPRLDDNEKRTKRIEVLLTEAEYEQVAARARREGNGDLSPFLRALALGESPSARRSRKADHAHRQLIMVLNNLDQIARALGGKDVELALEKAQAIYRRLHNGEAIERVSERAIEHLRAEGTALNRIARLANVGRDIKTDELQDCLHHILAALRAVEEEAGTK